MNYLKIYDGLIARSTGREKENGFIYECHHVVPRCMGGTDEKNNLVELKFEEHYFAHLLLARIYPEVPGLTHAAFMMATNNKWEGRTTNKVYSWLRKRHSFHMSNGWAKKYGFDTKDAAKIEIWYLYTTKSMTTIEILEKIGCSGSYVRGCINEYATEHNLENTVLEMRKKLADATRKKLADAIRPDVLEKRDAARLYKKEIIECICACGCGVKFEKRRNSKRVNAHKIMPKGRILSLETRDILSSIHKSNLSLLTSEELSLRSKNSFGNCDHIARGKSISESKRGKTTNQNQIEITRYGLMTDLEFDNHIIGRSPRIQTRMKNKRARYKNETNEFM